MSDKSLTFTCDDGAELYYRHWPAPSPDAGAPRKAVILLHRGHEHSGRIEHLVNELKMPDFDFFAWDARGHGQSPGEREGSSSFVTLVEDLQALCDHINGQHLVDASNIAVIAQSVGAVIAATWVHDYAPRIRALVLASPAFSVKLYIPFARVGLRLLRRLRGNFFVSSYVNPRFLTRDKQRAASYDKDPLITKAISVDVLLGMHESAQRVVADADAIQVPTQLLISGSDLVVHRKPQDRFYDRLGSRCKERQVFAGLLHDTLGERDRASVVASCRRFILQSFTLPTDHCSLLNAHLSGGTCAESEALARPLPHHSLSDFYWRAARAGIRLGSALSVGLKLGRDTGFDSGSTLDYVYQDLAQGTSKAGRLIDRTYLNSIGWKGIRQRKLHLEQLLRMAMNRLSSEAREIHIVDIAAGHGRYILDAIQGVSPPAKSILLRDYSDINVREGTALIAQKGLTEIASFAQGDAFDREDLATLGKPTLAVVSGLYELFADNQLVRTSLDGLAQAVEPGGYLIYTNQPWHPQLEFIARALTSHREGQPWVMRRRIQVEMDQLVEAAGFKKLTQHIDEWGIFSVSLAQRVL